MGKKNRPSFVELSNFCGINPLTIADFSYLLIHDGVEPESGRNVTAKDLTAGLYS